MRYWLTLKLNKSDSNSPFLFCLVVSTAICADKNFILKVTDMDNKRVERVRAIIIDHEEEKEK